MGNSDKVIARDVWSRPVEFFLTLVSYSVGPGNILRFPYLTMRNGGAAFLIPYFICLLVCGLPLFLLEIVMGQSTRKSCLGCWERYCPLLKGAGYAMIVVSGAMLFEFQCYMAWIIYYLAMSFNLELPWTSCNSTWNTPTCVVTVGNFSNRTHGDGEAVTYITSNSTSDNVVLATVDNTTLTNSSEALTAVEEFFQYNALELSSGIHEIGGLRWQLVVCVIVGWIIVVGCLIRGIRSSGKVVWVSSTLPYVVITIFLVRAAMLPGFLDGIHLYLTPDFDRLRDPEVWMMAFLQIFYSLGPGWGSMISMASFNKYHHNFLIEACLCPIVCCLTSFYAGFVTFGAAGFLAHVKGLPVKEAMKSGPGIAFISYPEMAAHLPGGPIWSILFFFMMLNVLFGTLFVFTETCISVVNLDRKKHTIALFVFAGLNIVLGLPLFTRGGMYIFQLIDWYFAVIVLFFNTTLECMVCMWLYGYNRFYDDIKHMIGRRPARMLMIPLWAVIIPALLSVGMVWSLVTISKPQYGSYVFPDWCVGVGWMISSLIVSPVFIYTVYKMIQARGDNFCKKMKILVTPVPPTESELHELSAMSI